MNYCVTTWGVKQGHDHDQDCVCVISEACNSVRRFVHYPERGEVYSPVQSGHCSLHAVGPGKGTRGETVIINPP